MSEQLTGRQQRIMTMLRGWIDQHGYPPTLREIGSAVGLRSLSSIVWQLNALVEKGLISRDADTPRGIRLLAKPPPDPPNATVLPAEHRRPTPHLDAVKRERDEALGRIEDLERQLDEAEENYRDLTLDLEAVRQERDRLKQQVDPLAAHAEQLQQSLAASQADLTSTRGRVVDLLYIIDAFQIESGADREASYATGIEAVRRMRADLTRAEWNADNAKLRERLDVAELELHKARMTLRAVAAEPGWQDVSPPQDSPPTVAGPRKDNE